MDDVVRRRPPQRRRGMRASLGAGAGLRRGGRVAERGRWQVVAQLERALARDRAARRGTGVARHRRRRRGRHLPAHVSGGRDRVTRLRAPRRRAGADLLRLRRAGDRDAARRRQREGPRHGRRLAATRRGGSDEADRGRRPRRRAFGRARRRLAAPRTRCADDAGARSLVGRARRRLAWPPATGRGRERGAVPHRVHIGHDGQAERRAPRPGLLPRVNRARGRVPGRPAARRPRPVRDRHGLDHGAVDRRRRRRGGSDDRLHGRSPRLAGRSHLAARRVGAGHDARRVADARPGPDPQGRPGTPTSRRSGP